MCVFYIVLYFISVIAESTQRGAPSPVPLTAEITAIVLRERGLLSVKRETERERETSEEAVESKRGLSGSPIGGSPAVSLSTFM